MKGGRKEARPAAQRGHAPTGRAEPALHLGEPVSAIEQRLALMAALLGMVARPGQPKSTPAVRAMATTAASRLKVLSVYFAIWARTVEAPRTLCAEATVSVAPGSLFRVRRS